VYIGEYNHTLDADGRISLPQAIINNADSSFIVVRGIEECVYVFDLNEWEHFLEKINEMAFTKKHTREFQRLLLSGAYQVERDSKGRINLHQKLIDHAKLKKECVIIGAANKMEIWDRKIWEEYLNSHQNEIEKISEEIEI